MGSRWDRGGIEVGLKWDRGMVGSFIQGAEARQVLVLSIDGPGGIQAHKDVLVDIYNGFSQERVCLGAIGQL